MSNLSIKPNIYSLAFGQMDLCCLNYRTIFRPRSPAQASSSRNKAQLLCQSCINVAFISGLLPDEPPLMPPDKGWRDTFDSDCPAVGPQCHGDGPNTG